MPRTARTVIVGVPYHVTQRGNRRQQVFFCDEDRRRYLSWLYDYSERYRLELLSYCLMTNHIHLVVIPHDPFALARTLQTVHMRHTQSVNARCGWSGHLWQGRFFSTALDDPHLWAAVRYVERNPVRAGLVTHAGEYRWSSAAFHLGLREDRLIRSETEWGRAVEDWVQALGNPEDEQVVETLRSRTQCGFPCGDEAFIARLSEMLGRPLVLRPRGRPRSR